MSVITAIILILDVIVGGIAALCGKYYAATYYTVLGIFFVLLFTGYEETDNEGDGDDKVQK